MEPVTQYFSANAFGLKRVVFDPQRKLRTLFHESSRHGIQSTDPQCSGEPLAYYHRSGPLGDVFSCFAERDTGAQVGVIGLGAGSMAAYAEPGRHFTFFEIDPVMAQIAADTRYFTFLSRCRGTYEIVIGDGLEMLGQTRDRRFDMIVLDAFSADTIPAHLVSRDALDVYVSKLAEGGMLAFHTSNVHVDLAPVFGRWAAEDGLTCLVRADFEVSDDERSSGKLPSQYVVMARGLEDLRGLADDPRWTTPEATFGIGGPNRTPI